MPKRKSELHLRTTAKSRKDSEQWNNMSRTQKTARIKQMLIRKADARVEQRHPKRIIYLPLRDKASSGVSSSSVCDSDLEDSDVFPTPFLPPSSQTDQPSSPSHREDELDPPTLSCARVCARENPGCGRPQNRGRGRQRGSGRGGVAGRGGGNAAGGDAGGDGDNDAGKNNWQQGGIGAMGPSRRGRPPGRRRG